MKADETIYFVFEEFVIIWVITVHIQSMHDVLPIILYIGYTQLFLNDMV